LATQILTFQPIKAYFVYEVLRNYPFVFGTSIQGLNVNFCAAN